MPSCLQLLLAQVHHAMGTILASPSLDIQGAPGRCPEGCSTDLGSITQAGQPLQGRGTGDLLVPGDLGWEQPAQHSSANQTEVQGSILQKPVPTTIPARRGWGSALLPPRHAAPAPAIPQLPTGLQRGRDHMSLR